MLLLFLGGLVWVSYTDLRSYLVRLRFSVALILLGFFHCLKTPFLGLYLLKVLFVLVTLYVVMFGCRMYYKQAVLGGADYLILIAIGLWVGAVSLYWVLWWSIMIAGSVSLLLISLKRAPTYIPFVPFITIGFLCVECLGLIPF